MRQPRSRAVVRLLLVLGSTTLLQGCAGASGAQPVGAAPEHFRLAEVRQAAAERETDIRVERVSSAPSGDFGWSVAEVDPSSNRLSISWTDSPHPGCGQADVVQVFETEAAVVIGVRETGARTAAACTADGMGHVTTVRLERPVGGRALVVPVDEASITGTTRAWRDGLMRSPAELPEPGCGVTGTPIGMVGATTMLAPSDPDAVTVCRYSWDGRQTVIARVAIDDPDAAAALARQVDEAAGTPRRARAGAGCDDVERTRYALMFSGPGMLAPVSTDAPTCGAMTNGVIAAASSPALARTLDALFPDEP